MSEGWTSSFLDVDAAMVPKLESMGYEKGLYEGKAAWWKDSENDYLSEDAVELSKEYPGQDIHFYWQSWRDGTPERHAIYRDGVMARKWLDGSVAAPRQGK